MFSAKTKIKEMKKTAEGDDIMSQVYEQARTIAMNESKRMEVFNRELFLIGQNTLERYGHEPYRITLLP